MALVELDAQNAGYGVSSIPDEPLVMCAAVLVPNGQSLCRVHATARVPALRGFWCSSRAAHSCRCELDGEAASTARGADDQHRVTRESSTASS
jgi:hypothetical protein